MISDILGNNYMKIKLLLGIALMTLSLKGMQESDRSLYFYFGSNPSVKTDDIKTIYESMAAVYNPANYEQSPIKASMHKEQAAEYFSKMSEAYEILSDVTARAMYDVFGLERAKAFLIRREGLLAGIKEGTEALKGLITHCHIPQYYEQLRTYHEKLCTFWITEMAGSDIATELKRAVVNATYMVIQFFHTNYAQNKNGAEIIKYIDLALNYANDLPLNDAQDLTIAEELIQLRNQYLAIERGSGSNVSAASSSLPSVMVVKRPLIDKKNKNNAVKRLKGADKSPQRNPPASKENEEFERQVEQVGEYLKGKSFFTTTGTDGLTVEEFYTEISKRLVFINDLPKSISLDNKKKCEDLFLDLIKRALDLLRYQYREFRSDAHNQEDAYKLGITLCEFGARMVNHADLQCYTDFFKVREKNKNEREAAIEKFDKDLKANQKSSRELTRYMGLEYLNDLYIDAISPQYQNKALKHFYKVINRLLKEKKPKWVAKRIFQRALMFKWTDCSKHIAESGIFRKFNKIIALADKLFVSDSDLLRDFCKGMKEELDADIPESIRNVKQRIINSSKKIKKWMTDPRGRVCIKTAQGIHSISASLSINRDENNEEQVSIFIELIITCINKLNNLYQQNDAIELIDHLLTNSIFASGIVIRQSIIDTFIDLKKQIMEEKKNEN